MEVINTDDIQDFHCDLEELKSDMTRKMDYIETIDLKMTIVSYSIYEKEHEFKKQLTEIKNQRGTVLIQNLSRSELSLQLENLDRRILDVELEHDEKLIALNQEKLELQEKWELSVNKLDALLDAMKTKLPKFIELLENLKQTTTLSESNLLEELHLDRHKVFIEEFQDFILQCEKHQLEGWKMASSDIRLSDILEGHGLKITKSGLILTIDGEEITYEEAMGRGLFKDIDVPLEKIFGYIKHEEKLEPTPSINWTQSSKESTSSTMSSEDVKYLKIHLGKPLTLALAEITSKQPKDPIHYLGHFLFKYRYNQDMEEVKKREVEELESERKILAKKRWDQFVEDEAQRAVYDIVLRTERLIYEREMKRIEEEMAKMAEEEGENEYLADEAKDKFDTY